MSKGVASFARGFLNKMGGSKKQEKNKGKEVCPECNGQGLSPQNEERSCPECDGAGVK